MIPKIFHRIWLGDKPMPEEFLFYGRTFEILHPDWEVKLWTDENLPVEEFVNSKLFEEIDGFVLKVDIARIELLNMFGGLYADTDYEFFRNMDLLIKDVDIFSAGEDEGVIGNSVLGSIPHHPVLNKILKAMPESIKKHTNYGPNIKTGPVFLTLLLDYNELTVFPSKMFFPVKYNTADGLGSQFSEAYGNHHWAKSWVGGEETISGYIPPEFRQKVKENRENMVKDKKISIIIPFRTDNGGYRDKNFNFIANQCQRLFPEAELIQGEDKSGDVNFCRGHAINDGVKYSTGDILIFWDAEIITTRENIEDAISRLPDSPFIIPFGRVVNLTEQISKKILSGRQVTTKEMRNSFDVIRNIRVGESQWGDKLAGGLQIMTKELFKKVGGYDERFTGWGWEDTVFCWKIQQELGDYEILPESWVYHLYHPQNNPLNVENYNLAQKLKEEWGIQDYDKERNAPIRKAKQGKSVKKKVADLRKLYNLPEKEADK
jgi:mannosyltransferase OCH1-like enzyme